MLTKEHERSLEIADTDSMRIKTIQIDSVSATYFAGKGAEQGVTNKESHG